MKADIGDTKIYDLSAAYNRGRVIKPIPTVTWSGRQLYNRRDFTVTYINDGDKDAFKEVGKYTIRVEGKGNFEGNQEIEFTIVDGSRTLLMSKVEISGLTAEYPGSTGGNINPVDYLSLTHNGKEIDPSYYNVRVEGDKTIQEIGTYQLIITGNGTDCVGTRCVTFTVTGKNILRANVEKIADRIYTGTLILQPELNEEDQLTINYPGAESPLLYGTDYTIECSAVNVGLAKVVIRGKGEYYGTLTRTFHILPVQNPEEEDGGGEDEAGQDEVRQIMDVSITIPDLVETAKAGGYRSTPVLVDAGGRRLQAGVDYNTELVYRDGNGTLLNETDTPPAGSEITVEVTGMGKYSGTIEATFRIVPKGKLLSAATVEVNREITYSGGRVTLSKEDLTVTVGNTVLADSNYRIKSLRSNAERGNAVIVLEGMGDYAGTRQVSIKIAAEEIVLWEEN
ncbi:MAG: hypothetical protein IJP31_12545 [Lachnospiraceae bacterium]|nr:hypothetical protein [Lachnospiraceae bacterium]